MPFNPILKIKTLHTYYLYLVFPHRVEFFIKRDNYTIRGSITGRYMMHRFFYKHNVEIIVGNHPMDAPLNPTQLIYTDVVVDISHNNHTYYNISQIVVVGNIYEMTFNHYTDNMGNADMSITRRVSGIFNEPDLLDISKPIRFQKQITLTITNPIVNISYSEYVI